MKIRANSTPAKIKILLAVKRRLLPGFRKEVGFENEDAARTPVYHFTRVEARKKKRGAEAPLEYR
jgi:hypothetical protein